MRTTITVLSIMLLLTASFLSCDGGSGGKEPGADTMPEADSLPDGFHELPPMDAVPHDEVIGDTVDPLDTQDGMDMMDTPDTADVQIVPLDPVTIGPAGGTVPLLQGASLEVPADALAADTVIIVTPIPAPDTDAFTPLGQFYRFEPEGLQFAQPATITLTFDSGLAPVASSWGLAWTDDAGEWDLMGANSNPVDGIMIGQVTHFSDGGPAAWGGGLICCVYKDETGAVVLEKTVYPGCAQVDGFDIGPEALCDDLTCCATASLGDVVITEELPVAFCEEHGTVLDGALCEPVCCFDEVHGQPGAAVTSEATCASVGGEVLGGAEVCEDMVCCGYENPAPGQALATKVPASICTQDVGAVLADGDCAQTCCLLAAGDSPAAVQLRKIDCEAQGGEILGGPALCQELPCCTWEGGAANLPEAACQKAGGAVAQDWACQEVCCGYTPGLVGAVSEVMTQGECDAAGGESWGTPEDCSTPVCCAGTDGLGRSVSFLLPETICSSGGTQTLPMEDCEPICCVVPGADGPAGQILTAGTCAGWGGIPAGAPADCTALICCALENPLVGGVLAVTLPSTACADAGGEEIVPEACSSVCCVTTDGGWLAQVLQAMDCAAAGGAELTMAECGPVCCLVGDEALVVPKAACDAFGVETGPAQDCADKACCELADGEVATMTAALCTGGGGTILPGEDCALVCCSLDGGSTVAVVEQAECENQGGTVSGDVAGCTEVTCCAAGPAGIFLPALVPVGDCPPDLLEDPSECETVCCITGEEPRDAAAQKTSAGTCNALDGLSTNDPADCDDMVCCGLGGFGDSTAAMLPASWCPEADIMFPSDCEAICCTTVGANGLSSSAVSGRGTCLANGGIEAGTPEDCEDLVCCGFTGTFGFGSTTYANVSEANCQAQGTTFASVQDPASCDGVCCRTDDANGVQTASVLSAGDCEEAGGKEVGDKEDCEALICCSTGGIFSDSVSSLKTQLGCALSLGLPTPMRNCTGVCCVVPQGEGFTTPEVLTPEGCEEAGGEVINDEPICDKLVCCQTLGIFSKGTAYFATETNCALSLGWQLDDTEACEGVCCLNWNANLMPVTEKTGKDECEGDGGIVLGTAADCEGLICCGEKNIWNDWVVAPMTPETCEEFEGTEKESDWCDPVCCVLGSGFPSPMMRKECEQEGGYSDWFDPDGCDCVPSCFGKSCGDDGCGGSCGDCGAGQVCTGEGQCVTQTPGGGPCVPQSTDYAGEVVKQASVTYDPQACTCSAVAGMDDGDALVLDKLLDGTYGASVNGAWTILSTDPDVGSGAWFGDVPVDQPITFTLHNSATGETVEITATLTELGVILSSIDCL